MKNSVFGIVAVVGVGIALCGCGGCPAPSVASQAAANIPSTSPVAKATEEPQPTALQIIDEAEDRRAYDERFAGIAATGSPEVKVRLALAIGRIADPTGAPVLIALFDDPDLQVRNTAVFAAGLLGENATTALKIALFLRLAQAAEDDIDIIALLDAVGRLGGVDEVRALIERAEDARPEVRAAALRALGFLGQRGLAVPDDITAKIATHLADSSEPVRFMSAFALYRIAVPKPGPTAVLNGLKAAAMKDGSAEVRAYAVKALARRGGLDWAVLRQTLADKVDYVGATSLDALQFLPDEPRCALAKSAFALVGKRVLADPKILSATYVHTVRSAFETVHNCAPLKPVAKLAAQIDKRLGQRAPTTAGESLVRCLARLVAGSDAADLEACDPQRPSLGLVMRIQQLAKTAATYADDLAALRQLLAAADPQVATAALGAIGELDQRDAVTALLAVLRDARPLMVSAALDTIAENASRFSTPLENGPSVAHAGVIAELGAIIARFLPQPDETAPLVSAAAALAALNDPAGEPFLRQLAMDRRYDVRTAAIHSYSAFPQFSLPAATGPVVQSRPVSHAEKQSWRSQRIVATLHTTRGEVKMELLPAVAPATVASFVELAEKGYFDGTDIHRVVANFVIQGGDPTGTGSGGPNYTLRCERNPIPYERGTVGMALSGKDTGGSQFFISHSRQPHLDGNYTVFGKVTSGMDVVDLIEQGDRILKVSIERR